MKNCMKHLNTRNNKPCGLSAADQNLMCRCANVHAQQQLQQQFEAQFLHKPRDLKAKLKSQLQQQAPAGKHNAELHWTSCMPGARLQREHLPRNAGMFMLEHLSRICLAEGACNLVHMSLRK